MGKPDKKLKKMLWILGITGAVYGSFRYLLPLVVPFLLAWGLAVLIRPSAVWLASRCRVRVFGKEKGIPAGAIGAAELAVILTLLAAGIYVGGCRLCREARLLMEQVPVWIERLDHLLTGICRQLEEGLCLREGCLVLMMREMLRSLLVHLRQAAMPSLMINSVSLVRWIVRLIVSSVILLVATGLFVQELDVWRKRCRRSIYREEFTLIGRRIAVVVNAYGKTQLLIMLLTTLICTAGFWFLGNPYYILAGVGIGILDALPVFGTGTVLIPWAVVLWIRGRFGYGLGVFVLYLICYFLREILEAKLMSRQVGLSPLETLAAMYVGLQLFGLCGFLLGPVGLLLIGDLVEAADPPEAAEASGEAGPAGAVDLPGEKDPAEVVETADPADAPTPPDEESW